jgi:penicillin amidase
MLPDYPHFISYQWALPFRFERIGQLVAAKPQHSLDDLGRMQADEVSLAARKMLPRLLKAQSSHALAPAAMAKLAAFDGTMAADQAAPLIYWAWFRHLSQQVLADELGQPLYDRLLGQRGYFDAMEGALGEGGGADGWWCDDKSTPAVETCQALVDRAFTAALDELQAAQGADVEAWRWGKAHIARSEHRPFSKLKPLARWFEVRVPVGGDGYTVNVSRVNLKADATTGELYLSEHGPSLRGLYDLADRSKSRVMHSTGQSGLPWSPLFRNLAGPWAQVQGVPLFPAADAPMQTLTISPAR